MIWFDCWDCDATFQAPPDETNCPYCESDDIEPMEEV